jgi:DNA-directed DNA polymerase III PolC
MAAGTLAPWIDDQHLQARALWEQAWSDAKKIVERRLATFGDRYYLETQIIPSDDQQAYNTYVRELAGLYGVPVVVTADAHYLRASDAELHKIMLKIRTERRKPKTEKVKVAPISFPEEQAAAILATGGDEGALNSFYDELIRDQMACTGKKLRTDTKLYATNRKKWATQAQLFYLQRSGDDGEEAEIEEDAVSLDAIDPGRSFADWSAEFWVRTPQEMLDAGAIPEELENTARVADRCAVEIPVTSTTQKIVRMPTFPVPVVYDEYGRGTTPTPEEYLAQLALQGLRAHLDDHPALLPGPYYTRLNYELDVITKAGFSTYFLIVWDYINYVRSTSGLIGPARGSSAASLCTFLLGITRGIDPLLYPDLMFERFLTPGRPDLPDIDTDFDLGSTERLVAYCQERYGMSRVAKIGTFSKIGARQALQDVAGVLDIPYVDVDKAAKILADFRPDDEQVLEDNKAMFSLEELSAVHPELAALSARSALHKQWFHYASGLVGMKRNASQHASGVAIADEPLVDLGIPLMATAVKSVQTITTQFSMDDLALLGVPKFDQLKLSSLSTLAECERLIGNDFTLDEVPLDDTPTYRALSSGDNLGIFQVGQNKVRGVLRAIRPQSLSDVAAVITVIRPGLFAKDVETGLTMEDLYKARRQGSVPVRYQFPFLQEILHSTYGIILYQENVLKILWACDIDILTSDKIRKIMSKKKKSELEVYREIFVPAAQKAQGLTAQEANELWDVLAEFAAYSFNYSHALSYGLITYWTSYLKTHYPAQFMSASLTVQSQKGSKAAKLLIPRLLEDCHQLGRQLQILPPDINKSMADFSVERVEAPDGLVYALRFGLTGIKNVGTLAQEILVERTAGDFVDLADFDARLRARTGRRPSKTALEALAYAGAFDPFYAHRSLALAAIALAREDVGYKRKALEELPVVPERAAVLAQRQAELCGNYYFVRDNLDVLGREADNFFTAIRGERVTIGGRVVEAKLDQRSKAQKPYHRIVLKTQWGDVSVDFYAGRTADPTAYLAGLKAKLFRGSVIFVTGQVRDERGLWGSTITLPPVLYRGVYQESDETILHEAELLLATGN